MWTEIEPHFTLRLKEKPTPPYAQRDFDKLRVESPGLENIPQVPANQPEVCQNHDTRKAVSATLSVLK